MKDINPHINHLIDELPLSSPITKLDLVFEGGLFNGSYLIGAWNTIFIWVF